jgi:ferrous iron transport protein A
MPLRRRADRSSGGLAGARPGVPVRLTAVRLEPADRLRLAELGLRPGAVVTVLRRMAGGARLIALGTSRIAVDPRTARALAVEDGQ